MAKISKPKKRETSVHSRAHRRNATPDPELPAAKKSKNEENEHWMYNAQNAGVHKKSKSKRGANTRGQHARHAKALEKADRNSAVLEKKVAKSKVKAKTIIARAVDWDELNESLVASNKPVDKVRAAPKDTAADMEDVEENVDIGVENVEPAAEASSNTQNSSTAIAAAVIPPESIDIVT